MMNLNRKDYNILNTYIGQGSPLAPVIFFGNEPGTSGKDIISTIKYLKTSKDKLKIGKGFLLKESYTYPVNSTFARFIARLMLGLEYKDERWFGELSSQGMIAINSYILKPLSEKNICLVNLRPLPRPTEDTWVYSNISKKEYQRNYNFTLKRHYSDSDKELRMNIFKEFFKQTKDSLIIGIGNKENKKSFFDILYENSNFCQINLDSMDIYYEPNYNIILSDYFDYRGGVKLQGLKELFRVIISRKLMNI